MGFSSDTIAAISSAVGLGARLIVRLSGPESVSIARSLAPQWTPVHGSAVYSSLSFGRLECPAWLYTFLSPRSYTGEDLIEFHLPGSVVLGKLLLDDLFARGVRLAEPGEFTARAYFAGKLNLAEAEGVAATIAAGNEQELQAARQLLAGELARRLAPTMDLIAQTLALIEVGIDFSEEDVTFLPTQEILQRFEQIDSSLTQLLEDTSRFEELSHEPRIVLVGRPNAGKSTLMNVLTGAGRAVVSDVAGTTRDVLTAGLDLEHGRVQLIDVAGIDSSTAGVIEESMQEHARRAIETADRIVLVQDATDLRESIAMSRPVDLVVISKGDLSVGGVATSPEWIVVSAMNGEGIAELRAALDRLAFGREGSGASLALNRRHVTAIVEAQKAINRAAESTQDNAAELIALELRESLDELGGILGDVTPDDVLGRIFAGFCIGK
jgi:tRNA modification GTPase